MHFTMEPVISSLRSFRIVSSYGKSLSSCQAITVFFGFHFSKDYFSLYSLRDFVQFMASSLLSIRLLGDIEFFRLRMIFERQPILLHPFSHKKQDHHAKHVAKPVTTPVDGFIPDMGCHAISTISPVVNIEMGSYIEKPQSDDSIETLYMQDPITDLTSGRIIPLNELYVMLGNDTIEGDVISELIEHLEIM